MLFVLLAVFVLLAIAVAWLWLRGPREVDAESGRAVAEAFLAAIRAGSGGQAWESTTAEFKSAQGRESFLEYVKKHPFLAKPLAFVSLQTVSIQGSSRVEYLYRPADGKNTVRVLVADERGVLRVDRVAID
jgi:hypothetical protein